jgi:drug/metabolite transporter (DMT)-like permease
MTALTETKNPSKALVIAAFAAVYIIWGSTYLGIKYAIETIPPLLMASIRFFVAGSLLMIWCMLKGESLPNLKSLLWLSISGILMLFVGNGSVAWIEQYLPSGLAAIIVATVPLWFVILDKRQWAYHFSNKLIIVGLLIGFAGVLVLFWGKGAAAITGDKMKLISFFVLIVGTIGWTVGSLISKYKKTEGSTSVKVAVQMLSASTVAFFVSLFTEKNQFDVHRVSAESLWGLIYLITMGSLVAFMAYVWLLSVRPASVVGTYAYVNPIVAVFLGWLMVNEPLGAQQIIALAIILAGVILVNLAKDKQPENAPSKEEGRVKIHHPAKAVTTAEQGVGSTSLSTGSREAK